MQDVTAGIAGDRAGLRAYDVIVALDDRSVVERRRADSRDRGARAGNGRAPARPARRPRADGHREAGRAAGARGATTGEPRPDAVPSRSRAIRTSLLGLTVRDLDRQTAGAAATLPRQTRGRAHHPRRADERVVRRRPRARHGAARDQPRARRVGRPTTGASLRAAQAGRRPRRSTSTSPELDQRQLKTVRVEDR